MLWLIIARVVLIVVSVVGLALWLAFGMPIIGATVVGLVVAYIIWGLHKINGTQVGVDEVLGDPNKHRGPGLYSTLPGLSEIIPYPGTNIQRELPADPEKIYNEEGQVPEGMFPPNRVKFGQPREPEHPEYNEEKDGLVKEDPYNVAMVAAVPVVVDLKIDDAKLFRLAYGTLENCLQIMNDKALAVVSARFAQMTPARALLDLTEVSEEIQKLLAKETAGKGVTLNDAYIKQIHFSHDLNTAVVGVQIAERAARALEHTATGEANAERTRGQGKRDAMLATGLLKKTGVGDEVELAPDGNVKANTDAFKEGLTGFKGQTLVVGNGVGTNINVGGNKP